MNALKLILLAFACVSFSTYVPLQVHKSFPFFVFAFACIHLSTYPLSRYLELLALLTRTSTRVDPHIVLLAVQAGRAMLHLFVRSRAHTLRRNPNDGNENNLSKDGARNLDRALLPFALVQSVYLV